MKIFFFFILFLSLVFLNFSCGDDKNNGGDAGNTGDDTEDAGNTGDDDDSGDTEIECTGISFENLSTVSGYDRYQGLTAEQIGDPTLDDTVSVQFYKEDYSDITELAAGTYNLAEGLNVNYGTCLECVLLYIDWNGTDYAETYFQESGTLIITEIKPGTIESKGTVSAKLVEVTINSEDFTSTPVEGGGCYEIEAGVWDNICVPDCDGKICGNDGCGQECGEGCGPDKACNSEGTACTDFLCDEVTIGEAESVDVMESENYWSYSAGYEPSTGQETADEILVQLFSAPLANDSFDLSGTNYSDSDQRILALEDPVYDSGGNLTGLGKMYFQQKGTITFESFDPATGKTKASITDLRLIEVTIEQGTYISTPVDGGTCLELSGGTIDIQ